MNDRWRSYRMPAAGEPLREYRDVTPLSWGEQFYDKIFVSRESLRLVEAKGGGR